MVDKSGGGVVNATTFSFNPNLRELCADIVFLVVKTNLTALNWFFTAKAAKLVAKTSPHLPIPP